MINLDLHQIQYSNNMDPTLRHSFVNSRDPSSSSSVHSASLPPPPASLSTHTSFEPSNTSFAFLVHSQDTIPNNLPPNVDNKPLARQRRRRTSPEDQIILEEEYQRDSKPDKNARKKIVERVALGEKEVQIWFQNRRQNCRRKSRPLLPHEIMSHLEASRARSGPASSDLSIADASQPTYALDSRTTRDSASIERTILTNVAPTQLYPESAGTISPTSEGRNDSSPTAASVGLGIILPEPTSLSHLTLPALQALRPLNPRQLSCNRPLSVADLISPEDTPSARGKENNDKSSPSSCTSHGESKPTLKRSRSHLRLSLTSDGAAKITTGEDSSPSPPRTQPLANPSCPVSNGLRRSYSSAGLSDATMSPRLSESNFGLRRVPSGRSRDSRAWEFWCDNEARNELQKIAEQERTGSAADAISLMRSNSRTPLTPNLNKANASMVRLPSAKRMKVEAIAHPKPFLGRTQSSLARLQGITLPPLRAYDETREEKTSETEEKLPKLDMGAITSTGSDSDKENWEPGTDNPAEGRRRHLQARTLSEIPKRLVLGESTTFSGRTSSLRAILNDSNDDRPMTQTVREARNDKENVNPEHDEETARLMGSRRPKASPSKYGGEDLDCIQGLLSLSQGAWR